VAWTDLGYTEEGSSFVISPSYEDINVGEELEPIDVVAAGRGNVVNFALAQVTAENLAIVLNGGVITTSGARAIPTVGTTTTSPLITAPAGSFDTTGGDVGATITGAGIPASTTILSVQSATAATMSANATATGSITATVTRLTTEKHFEPSASDAAPVYTALGWRGDTSKEQYVWRKALQTGDIEIGRRRTAKATLPASFRCLVPSPSVRSFAYKNES
jgi:hypothetical protein